MSEISTGMPDDAPTVTVEATSTAPPATLWHILTDINASAPYSDEFVGATWLHGEHMPTLGARFEGHNERGERRWTTTSTVTLLEPGRRFGWTVDELDDPVASWTFDLEPDGDGSRIRYTARLGPSAASGLNRAIAKYPDRAAQLTAARLASLGESMQRTIDAFAREAEEERAHG